VRFTSAGHPLRGVLTVVALLWAASPASAEIYGFGCITGNSATDCLTLERQLRMEVTAGDADFVNFRFTNSGPAASSVTAVYFDDLLPALLGSPSMISDSGSGVSFSSGCAPGNLPGGNPYGFTTSYCADSDRPTQPMGVNPGEWLNIAYTLQAGTTLQDVIGALDNGSYRVGLHVQGFSGGGSESAVATHRVPEPTALMFVGTGLLLAPLGRRLRRRLR